MGICGFNHFKLCVKNLDKNPTVVCISHCQIAHLIRYGKRLSRIFFQPFEKIPHTGTAINQFLS